MSSVPKKTRSPRQEPAARATTRTTARTYDPEQTRRDILDVATEEFSAMGLAGARVDMIAARTRTTKRMIYYYFGSKEGLYLAVLDKVYGGIRAIEQEIDVSTLDPEAAMRQLVELTFDYHEQHPEFVRLVSIENIHGAEYLKHSESIRGRNVSVIQSIEKILAAGVEQGVFRPDVDPIDLHMLISSFCFHRVSNHHTFGTVFGRDPLIPKLRVRHRRMIVEAVLLYLAK